MQKRRMLFTILLLSLSLALTGGAAVWAEAWTPLSKAESFTMNILQGDYAAILEQADDSIKAALTADAIAQAWQSVLQAVGPYASLADSAEGKQGDFLVVQLLLQHEAGQSAIIFAFNEAGAIVGLSIQPSMASMGTQEEPLPLPDGAAEEEIALRPGEADETGGLLMLPEGEGPYPAVVLIHGSGASDRDEAVYGLKPFRDIAVGLCVNGVASLRYDKYPYAHSELVDNNTITIAIEYEKDVQDAVALLKADSRISDIYLVGHSEGGMLIPRLMSLCAGDVKGGVILAGTPRSMWEIQAMQNEDVIAAMPEADQAPSRAIVDAELAKAARLDEMSDAELAEETLFGIPAAYHKDLTSVDAIETAKSLGLPLFIAQGGKDFQVKPDIDFAAWKEGLEGEGFVTFALYPDLTHVFMPLTGEPTGTVEDYTHGGHVAEQVIQDIAAFIK